MSSNDTHGPSLVGETAAVSPQRKPSVLCGARLNGAVSDF